jgi:hypothetical protein
VVGVAGARVHDGEAQRQGLLDAERIDECGGDVRNQLHIGLGDALETADRGTVEELAVHEEVGVDRLGRHIEVLLDTGQVREPDVDEFHVLVGDVLEDFVRIVEHRVMLLTHSGESCRPLHGATATVSRVGGWNFPRVSPLFPACYRTLPA